MSAGIKRVRKGRQAKMGPNGGEPGQPHHRPGAGPGGHVGGPGQGPGGLRVVAVGAAHGPLRPAVGTPRPRLPHRRGRRRGRAPRAPLRRRRRLHALPLHGLHPQRRRPGRAPFPPAGPARGWPRLRGAAAAAAAAGLLLLLGRGGRRPRRAGRVGRGLARARVAHGGGRGVLLRNGDVDAGRRADGAQGPGGHRVPAQAIRQPHAQPRRHQVREKRNELRTSSVILLLHFWSALPPLNFLVRSFL